MRSTQKKGPRTRAVKLVHAAHPSSIESRVSAALASAKTAAVINAMWANAAAGRCEPPEPEAAPQNTSNKPPPMSGGAEASMEHRMEHLEQIGQMAAAEWARANATTSANPAQFGKDVVQVYRACLNPASSIPRSALPASLQCSKRLPRSSPDSTSPQTATNSADAR